MGASSADVTMASRQAISAVALRLFATRGYDHTTVADIAAAAGLSRATVFRYFRSKDDILFDRYNRQFEHICRQAGLQRGSDLTRARRALVDLAGRLESEGDAFRLELNIIVANDRLRARAIAMMHDWGGVLARELSNGASDGVFATRVVAQSTMAAVLEAICMWLAMDASASLVSLTQEALRMAGPARARPSHTV
ncbi:MAG TPA: helix-turn-helix domain-containing protein [Acidimicrobiia bacterium]|nr:helix-turn-helix domain-containing protein [Acidimicrobiia bacterium]